MTAKTIGERVKELRLQRGWSLGRLAEKVGTSTGYLSLVESGARIPKLDNLEAIARAFGVDIKVIREGTLTTSFLNNDGSDARLDGADINLLAIKELDPDEYELIVQQLVARREKLERERKEIRRAQRRRSEPAEEPGPSNREETTPQR